MMSRPLRRWFSALSPFRWIEAWLERMERRQREMLRQLDEIQRRTAELRAEEVRARAAVVELRAEIERLRGDATAAGALSSPSGSLPLPPTPPPVASGDQRRCPRGHRVPTGVRFCPECGHVFPTRSGGND